MQEGVSKVKRPKQIITDCYLQDGLKAQKHIAQGNALGDFQGKSPRAL